MLNSLSRTRAGVMVLAFLLITGACGGDQPSDGSPTSGAAATTAAAPTADVETSSVDQEPADEVSPTTSTPSEATPGEEIQDRPEDESPSQPSTTVGATADPVAGTVEGCPPPPDTPPISRPVVTDNPHAPPSHLQNAVAPWPTDWSLSTVDVSELGLGIHAPDPRDLIPPLDRPVFVDVAAAGDWLSQQDPGMLVRIGGHARFYPLRVLTRHEIVNDRFGDRPVSVTYCPLCNTAVAFDPVVDGTYLRFGVSGLLRHSDLVMWDLETTSLWQQVTGEAIVGTYAGETLEYIPSAIVAFSEFASFHPDGCVLGPDQEFGISYGVNPYFGYSSSTRPFLYNGELDDRLPALSRVVGVSIGEHAKAYPFADLASVGVINDTLGDTPIAVMWGAAHTADALDDSSIPNSRPIGTGVAFLTGADEGTLTFSVAGEDLFTDDLTDSTWNLLGQAIDGPLAGTQLAFAPHRNEFWFAWFAFFGPTGELWAAS